MKQLCNGPLADPQFNAGLHTIDFITSQLRGINKTSKLIAINNVI